MIRIFYGAPGAGKTSLAHFLTFHSDYSHYVCNFKSKLITDEIDMSKHFGKYSFPVNTKIYVDEAGIDWNNRNYKNFTSASIAYLKKHRHEEVDIDVFSQAWDDMDITVRRLANEVWYMKKIGPFTFCRLMYKFAAKPNEESNYQPFDGYKMRNFFCRFLFMKSWFIFFRPPYYKYFDSFDKLGLPPFPYPLKEFKRPFIQKLLLRKF